MGPILTAPEPTRGSLTEVKCGSNEVQSWMDIMNIITGTIHDVYGCSAVLDHFSIANLTSCYLQSLSLWSPVHGLCSFIVCRLMTTLSRA